MSLTSIRSTSRGTSYDSRLNLSTPYSINLFVLPALLSVKFNHLLLVLSAHSTTRNLTNGEVNTPSVFTSPRCTELLPFPDEDNTRARLRFVRVLPSVQLYILIKKVRRDGLQPPKRTPNEPRSASIEVAHLTKQLDHDPPLPTNFNQESSSCTICPIEKAIKQGVVNDRRSFTI